MKTAHVITLENRQASFHQVAQEFRLHGVECVKEIGSIGRRPATECTKTHFGLVRRAQGAGNRKIMVFEDDCLPQPAMACWPDLKRYLEKNHKHWDVFYGGATAVHPQRWRCDYRRDHAHIIECSNALSVHFVVYNQSSFAKILAWFDLPAAEEARPVVDDYLRQSGLRLWTTAPMLAIQRPSFSRTLNREVDYTEDFRRAEKKLFAFVQMRKRSLAYRLFGPWLSSV